jgi:hypothetical protein
MVLARIQMNSLDTGLRRYDAWDLDTHLCGVVLSFHKVAYALGTLKLGATRLRLDGAKRNVILRFPD